MIHSKRLTLTFNHNNGQGIFKIISGHSLSSNKLNSGPKKGVFVLLLSCVGAIVRQPFLEFLLGGRIIRINLYCPPIVVFSSRYIPLSF